MNCSLLINMEMPTIISRERKFHAQLLSMKKFYNLGARSASALAQFGQTFSLGSLRIAKDAKFLHADNEDSYQTARMHRLI